MSAPAPARPGFLRRWVLSTDPKVIGIQFGVTSLALLLLGGLLALALRWQLAWPWSKLPLVGELLYPDTGGAVTPEGYAVLFTMHGTIMVFFVIIPLLTGAFGNYLVPLMIGARDMAFPRLNAASYWLFWPAIGCLLASFLVAGGGPAAGWTAYAPLATIAGAAPGSGAAQTLWLLALLLVGTASLLGAINYLTTIATLRAAGLGWMRLPLTVWALLFAAALQLVALPVLTAGTLLQLADRLLGTGFFAPANLLVNQVATESLGAVGGEPILWQHLFWFYSHPAVYVMVLPAMGIVSDVLSVHARKPIFGYRPMVLSMAAIVLLSFLVWGHHMFVSGMDPTLGLAFEISTTAIALPSAIKVFNWLATLWGARIRFTTAMLFAIAFVALFVLGGLSGIWLASTPVDVTLHETYVVVAHFHYIVFGGSVFAIFAGIYHWFPKVTGRRLSEALGRVHFVGTFLLGNAVFLPMHQLGLAGMLRRTADPYVLQSLEPLRPWNVWISVSAIALLVWQAWLVANLARSLARRPAGERNPWEACTLEWATSSPPPRENFAEAPRVTGPPYAYADPAAKRDWAPQAPPASG